MESISLHIAPLPLLGLRAFTTEYPRSLGESPTPAELLALLHAEAPAPLARDETCRTQVRDLLRQGGYKPTGRGKPSAEYLLRAAEEDGLTTINLAVDACNAVSLHSGLPISVVDLERTEGTLHVRVAAAGESYVFNASGQTIDVGGLLCLFDDQGPCANAVKDAQRTKTTPATRRTLSVLWAPRAQGVRADSALAWYRRLLESAGATTTPAETRDDLR